MPEQLAPGGQILQTEAMDNYPGFPKGIKGYELADLFAAHLEGLAIDRPAAAVESVSGSAGQFVVRAGGVEYGARTVVVCSGAHHRKLGLEGEDRLRRAWGFLLRVVRRQLLSQPDCSRGGRAAMPRWKNPCICPNW